MRRIFGVILAAALFMPAAVLSCGAHHGVVHALAFPMLATAVWLFSLALNHLGEAAVFWLGLFLVMVWLAAWVFGEFGQRGRQRRGVAVSVALVLVAGAYVYALEKKLSWRSPG